jgi:hypothetical protein
MTTAIFSERNQYLGVNAHLHSHFLHDETEGWEEFHGDFIVDLTRALNADLRPMGYAARRERSLQLRLFDESQRRPKSDVLISDVNAPVSQPRPSPVLTGLMEEVVYVGAANLLTERLEDIKRPGAIQIYEQDKASRSGRGKPVAWLELLSPSNKSGSGYHDYVEKRDRLLDDRLVFVEIDLVHGVSTSLESIQDYRPSGRTWKPIVDAYPYHIWMIDPRAAFDDPQSGGVASFSVDQPIPMLKIPLNHGDHVLCDFGSVYRHTFEAQPAFSDQVDYSRPPVNAAADYNARDLRAIAARMLTVQALAARGVDLMQGPFPVDADVSARLAADPAQLEGLFSTK